METNPNSSDDEMFADSKMVVATDEEISNIAELAEIQIALENVVTAAEQTLKDAKERYRKHSTETMPQAMDSAGLPKFTTREGVEFSVDDFMSVSIKKDLKPEAHEWMRNNEAGELIKNSVNVPFAKGEDKAALELVAKLKELGYDGQAVSDVHFQTLNAWAKEQIAEGRTLPDDLLNIFVGRVAKIKRKKKG